MLTAIGSRWVEAWIPDEGLSVIWDEAGEQQVLAQPLASVAELTGFLLGYLFGTDDRKTGTEWAK